MRGKGEEEEKGTRRRRSRSHVFYSESWQVKAGKQGMVESWEVVLRRMNGKPQCIRKCLLRVGQY